MTGGAQFGLLQYGGHIRPELRSSRVVLCRAIVSVLQFAGRFRRDSWDCWGCKESRHCRDSLLNPARTESRTDRLSKGTATGPLRETPPNTREVVSNEDRHGEHARAILAEHRDNLRETENVYLLSRLVGGGGEI